MNAAVDDFVHRFEPGAASPPARTLLLLHGTGGNEDDLLPLGRILSPGAALLSPRGKVLENGMPRFFRRFAEGVFDVGDLKRRTHELADWVGSAAAAYPLAESPPIAVGFSNGANIAASMLLLRPEALSGALLLRATLPFEPEALPGLDERPVFIAAGRADPFVRPADVERLAAVLGESGARVSLRWSDSGHELAPGDMVAARDWLQNLRAD
jgi:predicted esterase